jgi:hypothetical protein
MGLVEPVSDDTDEWFNQLKFVFAKTMPEIPHEYTIRRPENWDAFMKLWDRIGERGVPGSFRGRWYKYWYRGDGYRYWNMGSKWPYLINRAKVEAIIGSGDGSELSDPDRSGSGQGAD